jgi:hypothetical protein
VVKEVVVEKEVPKIVEVEKYITKEVPKIVEVEKYITKEVPKVVEVPVDRIVVQVCMRLTIVS